MFLTLFGVRRSRAGRVEVGGRPLTLRSPRDAIKAGIALVPGDRKGEGLLLPMSVKENVTLATLHRHASVGMVRLRTERGVANETIRRLQIRTRDEAQPVGRLSGGNQQKVLIGRWLLIDAKVLLFFGVELGTFPGNFELTSTVDNAVPLVFAALGQALIILTGGIDLSVGGVMGLTNGLAALHLHGSVGNILLWSVLIVGIGAAAGLLNGLRVAFGRLQPILVTLGTLAIFQGLALWALPQPGGQVASGVTDTLVNPHYPTDLIVVAVALVLWWLLRRSSLGVGIFALGNDRTAARAVGIPVLRVILVTYTLSGALVGLLLAAQTTRGDATAGDVFTLVSIAAAVIGGVSLAGGRGSGVGAVVGAFVLTVLVNVLFFGHVDPLEEPLYEGLFLMVAAVLTGVAAGVLRRRLS